MDKHRRLLQRQKERKQEHKQEQHTYNSIYHDHYKLLLIFTFGILLASLAIIGYTYVKTGDIFYKGVSLSGGVTMTITAQGEPFELDAVEAQLRQAFPESDIALREISDLGTQQAITIEATTADNSRESLDRLSESMLQELGIDDPDRVSTEVTGPALGDAFFRQTFKAVLMAFVFMGMVIFIYFGETIAQKSFVVLLSIIEVILIWYAGHWLIILLAIAGAALLLYMYIRYSIPSTAVILAAFATMCFTIAVLDLFQMRVSTAGIAALLMIIGYSVDTDILLSTRVLKSNAGTVYQRVVSTVKTGLTMTGTTLVTAIIALIFAQSEVIREIMTIIAIGIVADVFFTWIQNAGILRMYLERKGRRSDDA